MFGTRYDFGLRGVGDRRLRVALTTASAEAKWRNGFAIGATFEGEFSNVTRSCACKGNRTPCVVSFTIGPASSC
jgi:hypothetical protein